MLTAGIWLSFAFVLGLLVRQIGLPPLIGYLAAGFSLSAFGYESNDILKEISHAGVLLLLFSVGLKLRLGTLIRREVLVGSLLHMGLLVGLTYLILLSMVDLEPMLALMAAIALGFSSTVVAAKVLESKRELRAFHGRVAMILLGLIFLRPLLFRLLDVTGHGELVVLYGLLLALVVGGSSFEYLGLSSELGALFLGIMLASHKRAEELSYSIWSLKEVLLVGFFLQIGLLGHPDFAVLQKALLINALLPLKAVLFFFVLLLFRLRARSAFLASLSLATFSEFGLIVANMAVEQNLFSAEWMVLLAVTVAISFAITAPLNRRAHEIYERLEQFLGRFESRKRHPDDEPMHIGNSHVIVMGMGRVGSGAYDLFSDKQFRVIGLDSDPITVEQHRKQGRRVLYADAEDPGLWSNMILDGVHTIMLAMPELEAKVQATRQLRKRGFTGVIATTVVFEEEMKPLKAAGADHVYNYYDGVGTSFAQSTIENAISPNES
jgi:predicted Kef-type K+ transport protein